MKEKTKAFLAGLFDSEGDVSISRHYTRERTYVVKGKPYTYGDYTSYGVSLAVYNTYLPLMKYLVHHFGGTYRVLRKETATRQTMYSWEPDGITHDLTVLRLVLPYITLKKEQALVCIKFLELGTTTCPDARKSFYEEYEGIKSNSLTTETNHILSWKNNLQNAYLSAIFDGEGTAAVYKTCSTIVVANSNRNLLETMRKIYDGNEVRGGFRNNSKPTRLPEYVMTIPNSSMEKFILRMLPYSLIKREQLALTLENLREVSEERQVSIKKKLHELKHPLTIKIQSELMGDHESASSENL